MTEEAKGGSGGWFELRTPTDLFQKLRHDCRRVQEEPSDSFAAFDFFVTAWHILDWLHPGRGNEGVRSQTVSADPLLAVCHHIATGAKHFLVENRRAKSVVGTEQQGTFDQTFDFTFDRIRLALRLDGAAAEEFGEVVDVAAFAEQVVGWWARKLGVPL